MPDKTSVKVQIFGSEYQIKGEADKEYIEQLARLVDQKMRELAQPGGPQPLARVAILAAFNLADELSKTRQALQHQHQAQEQTRGLAADLDSQLQEALQTPPEGAESPEQPEPRQEILPTEDPEIKS